MEGKSTANYVFNCGEQTIDFTTPQIMGIVNVTPDSFYDGGSYNGLTSSVARAIQLHEDGANIIDIGGQSTKPGATSISEQEELDRIASTIETLHNYNPKIVISVDTYYSYVAKNAVALGASIINDVSAGEMDADIIAAAAALGVPYIAMHMQGKPATMQVKPAYSDVVKEVHNYLERKIKQCLGAGIKQIAIDPGFGFGKTLEQNYVLLKNLSTFTSLQYPVLVGLSRKSMLYKALNILPQESLNATTAAHMIALQHGANILRVHDAKEAQQAIEIFKLTNNA
jgi:dihydropteroate synthase